jgi:hypothetical protein
MGDDAPPDGNDEGMTHTELWKRNMHRDQWLGIW